jgi:hypothetical protein
MVVFITIETLKTLATIFIFVIPYIILFYTNNIEGFVNYNHQRIIDLIKLGFKKLFKLFTLFLAPLYCFIIIGINIFMLPYVLADLLILVDKPEMLFVVLKTLVCLEFYFFFILPVYIYDNCNFLAVKESIINFFCTNASIFYEF